MQSRLLSGATAGIAAGVVFGIMMQLSSAPTPDGGTVPMMQMVASVVGSDSIGHLVYGLMLGGVFVWLAHRVPVGRAESAAL